MLLLSPPHVPATKAFDSFEAFAVEYRVRRPFPRLR